MDDLEKEQGTSGIAMEHQSNEHVIVNIGELESSLKEDPYHLSTSCGAIGNGKTQKSICRVRHHVREKHKHDYDPVVVSIGPYHHGNASLRVMERNKWNYLDLLLALNGEKSLGDYVKVLRELYPLATRYYADTVNINRDELVKVFLRDGCFVLMSLYGAEWAATESRNSISEEDTVDEIDLWQNHYVMHDLLLLENQIPFFILKTVFELVSSEANIAAQPSEKMAIFVEHIFSNCPKGIRESDRPKEFCHLLQLCHMYLRPCRSHDSYYTCHGNGLSHKWHQASEYCRAGIQVRKREFDENCPHSLLDVRFRNCQLEIPYLEIGENIITIFRNLIALEQSCPQFGNDFISYISFMSYLVDDAKDVDLLVSRGILVHHYATDEEVSNLFKELCADIVAFDFSGSYYLKDICEDLDVCYRHPARWLKGWFSRVS